MVITILTEDRVENMAGKAHAKFLILEASDRENKTVSVPFQMI